MSTRILIDTSAYAHFRRGQVGVVEMMAAAESIFVSAVTLGELEAGFILGSRPDENRNVLRDFLMEPFVKVVSVDDAVSQRYGRLFADLRKAGTPVPANDIWIAACALHVGARLITFDTDFSRFRDLDPRVLVV